MKNLHQVRCDLLLLTAVLNRWQLQYRISSAPVVGLVVGIVRFTGPPQINILFASSTLVATAVGPETHVCSGVSGG